MFSFSFQNSKNILVEMQHYINYIVKIQFFQLDTMRPICLPLLGEEDADLDGFKMVATGWGKTHDGNNISP